MVAGAGDQVLVEGGEEGCYPGLAVFRVGNVTCGCRGGQGEHRQWVIGEGEGGVVYQGQQAFRDGGPFDLPP